MEILTQIINFIMHLIEMIKALFGGAENPDADKDKENDKDKDKTKTK